MDRNKYTLKLKKNGRFLGGILQRAVREELGGISRGFTEQEIQVLSNTALDLKQEEMRLWEDDIPTFQGAVRKILSGPRFISEGEAEALRDIDFLVGEAVRRTADA